MFSCLSCKGFIPEELSDCPNCLKTNNLQSAKSSLLRKAACVVGASLVSVTLMACYGAPPGYLKKLEKERTDNSGDKDDEDKDDEDKDKDKDPDDKK
jgi:hypothetical protein